MKQFLNDYGNVDIRYGVPIGCEHFKGDLIAEELDATLRVWQTDPANAGIDQQEAP